MNVHDNVFDFMLSPELASNSFMQRPSHCCGASATQDREMAYKLKEIKHREAMKRQAELEKKERRFKEQRRRHKTKTRLHFTVLDDSSPRYLAVGARMNTEGIGAENVEIRGKNGQLTITVSKRVPMYRHVRDIFGNVALQRCGTKTEKAWSETVDVDPSLDVEHVSARLYDNMLVMQLPYKKEEKSKEVLIESSREDDAPSTRSEPEAQAKEETQTTHEEQDASDGIQIHIEDSPRTSDKDIWEKLDGSVEDCEYE
jgi:hypothetical protein